MRSRPSGSATGLIEDDEPVADLADVGRLGDGQAVGQLHEHLRGAGLRRVQAAVQHVEGLEAGDQLLGPPLVGAPRVGQLGHGRPRLLQVVQALLVAHHHEQDLAALFGLADHLHAHAAGGGGQGAVVGVDLRGARELARRAHDVARGASWARARSGGAARRRPRGRGSAARWWPRRWPRSCPARGCPGPGRRPVPKGAPGTGPRGKGRAGGVASWSPPGNARTLSPGCRSCQTWVRNRDRVRAGDGEGRGPAHPVARPRPLTGTSNACPLGG